MTKTHSFDVLIIGSGAAGLSLALHLADFKVALLAKGSFSESCTHYAQGGIAALAPKNDSIESHVTDTINAGAGLCDPKVVEFVVRHGPETVDWLVQQGMPFSKHLTKEGGHSHRRVWHVNDKTGEAIIETLLKQIRKKPNITSLTEHTAIDIIKNNNKCIGAYALNNKTNKVNTFQAKFIVLATGGASKVYLYTSNPDSASGDGIAIGARAGCRVKNMEFNQFHPTCLFHPQAKSFLISEAVRGEGGKLLLPNGKRFMDKFDNRAELAPRDIVARAIDYEIKSRGIDCVYLDISFKSKQFIQEHFPHIYQNCLNFGFDMSREPLPVVPAAHYTCGGLVTDLNGQTSIDNLYAIGEVACTGLHGANRMASNSLLECFVFAKSASLDIQSKFVAASMPSPAADWDESQVTDSDEQIVVTHNWDEIRRTMWNYVGIVRTNKRLQRAKERIELLKREINEYYGNFKVTKDLLELRDLVIVADLIIKAALTRKQNVGLHYNLDNS